MSFAVKIKKNCHLICSKISDNFWFNHFFPWFLTFFQKGLHKVAQLGNIFENYFLLNSSQHPPNALFRHLLHLIESEKKTFTLIFIWTNPPVVFFILKPQEKISQIHSIFWLQFLLDISLFIPVLMFELRLLLPPGCLSTM